MLPSFPNPAPQTLTHADLDKVPEIWSETPMQFWVLHADLTNHDIFRLLRFDAAKSETLCMQTTDYTLHTAQ